MVDHLLCETPLRRKPIAAAVAGFILLGMSGCSETEAEPPSKNDQIEMGRALAHTY